MSRISISAVADANAPTRLPELQGVAPDVSLANPVDQPGGDKIDRQRTSRDSLWIELERAHCPAARFTAGGFLTRHNARSAVFEAGMKLFIERGFGACGVQDVTDAAGVPKGSFYNHFKSKEALAAEILIAYAKGTPERNIFTDPKLPALARLKKLFAALNEYFLRHYEGCMIGKFMAEVSDDTPRIRESLVGVLNLWDEEVTTIIRDGQKQGSIRKDLKADELAAFLFDSYEGAILRTRVEQSPRALKAFVKVVFVSIAA